MTKKANSSPALKIVVGVGIDTFRCEGAMAQWMTCRGIAIRLQGQYPGAEIFVMPMVKIPDKLDVGVQNFGDLNPAKLAIKIRKTVQDSLGCSSGDFPSAEQHLDDKFLLVCQQLIDLRVANKLLQGTLQGLISVTKYLILNSQGHDREAAQAAVATAEKVLGALNTENSGDPS